MHLSRRRDAATKDVMDASMESARQVAALPVRRAPDGTLLVLLVTTLQTQRWIIPKGWPWPGEQDHTAAAEEAREEAGVLGEAHPTSLGSYTYEKRRSSGLVPVHVSVYLLEVREELDTWPECGQRQRAWFTLSDASNAVEEPELKALLLRVQEMQGHPAAAD
jgi:8-oxo-dGTP pyrophosphatase MutT (NUDIX family)